MTAATSKMELFVIIVNGLLPLTIITKCSILDVVAVLDPRLTWFSNHCPTNNYSVYYSTVIHIEISPVLFSF